MGNITFLPREIMAIPVESHQDDTTSFSELPRYVQINILVDKAAKIAALS